MVGPAEMIAEVHNVDLLPDAVTTAAGPLAGMVRLDAGKIVEIMVTVVAPMDVMTEARQEMIAAIVVVDVPPCLHAGKTAGTEDRLPAMAAGTDDRLLAMIVLVMRAWTDSRWKGDAHAAQLMMATRRRGCLVGV